MALVGSGQAFKQFACVGAPEFGHIFVPSPLSCNHYILCINSISHSSNCPDGYDFNVRDQNCGQAGTVDCTQCADTGSINLPDANDCANFIECIFGVRSKRTCPPGLLFDRSLASCNHAHLVKCPGGGGGDPGVTPPGPEDPGVTPPGPDDPALTPPGPEDPNAPPHMPQCIPGGQMHHAHPTNCRRFFICMNSIAMEHECPSNLHWNERAMACDLPESAQCFRGVPTSDDDFVEQIDY